MDFYLCDNSIEGIFSAIYKAWEAGTSHTDVRCADVVSNYSLFENYINIRTDLTLSDKVANTIKLKLSNDIYEMIFTVAQSIADNKASVIYHCLQRMFKYGTSVLHNINDEYIFQFNKIYKKAANEAHFYIEILRFNENANGFLTARIEPDNNIIYMIIDHFNDRLHCENFLIYDVRRNIAYIHMNNNTAFFYNDYNNELLKQLDDFSDNENDIQNLWIRFYNTIAIKERVNYKCQINMLPLKYRKYLPELPIKKGIPPNNN